MSPNTSGNDVATSETPHMHVSFLFFTSPSAVASL